MREIIDNQTKTKTKHRQRRLPNIFKKDCFNILFDKKLQWKQTNNEIHIQLNYSFNLNYSTEIQNP
jgi:hypothetical protein